MKIKICGLTREVDIDYVNELKPDFAGFIFVKGRRRYAAPEIAKEFISKLKPEISSVAVFLNESQDLICKICEMCSPDLIQLHGDEDNKYINEIRKKTALPVIKAFKVQSADDVLAANNSDADIILLDAGEGDGKVFEWKLLDAVTRPYMLAGGLNCDNVRTAITDLSPYGIDLSSGVETDGFKDYTKIKEIIEICRDRH